MKVERKNGVAEYWSNGLLEYWDGRQDGLLKTEGVFIIYHWSFTIG